MGKEETMKMGRKLGLFLLLVSTFAPAADIYITQATSGGDTGANCANAHSVTWFNSNQAAGNTYHMCGTFTAAAGGSILNVSAGSAGNIKTILFESGAVMTAPVWGSGAGAWPTGGAININGSYVTVDGGTNGQINATDSGGSGTTCPDGTSCSYDRTTAGIVVGGNLSTIEIKNLNIQNIFRCNGGATCNSNWYTAGIFVGPSVSATNYSIHDNVIDGAGTEIFFEYDGRALSNVNVYNNTLGASHGGYWGIAFACGASGCTTSNVNIYGNTINGCSEWDGQYAGGNGYHCDGVIAYSNGSAQLFNIYNNFMTFTGGHTGNIMCTYGSSPPGATCNIFNNVLQVSNSTCSGIGGGRALWLHDGAGAQFVMNNTLVGNNSSCFLVEAEGSVAVSRFQNNILTAENWGVERLTTGNLSNADYNLYNTPNAVWKWGGSYDSFATWQGRGFDAHGLTGNPNLDANYKLQASSTYAIGRGTNLNSLCNGQPNPGIGALCFDKAGVARPSSGAWDIGAYQYSAVVGAPIVSLTGSLNFGNQMVGVTSASQPATLQNTGNASLRITTITASGDFAQTNNCPISPSTLAAGSSCTITVTFTPTAIGSSSGAITVNDDASGSPHTVSLSGNGVAPAVSLTASIDFGDQNIHTTSVSRPATLQNTGTAALTITSISTTGDFAQTNNCPISPSTLAIAAFCTINITFTPTAVDGRSGTVSVADNASGNPHSVTLSGNGMPGSMYGMGGGAGYFTIGMGVATPARACWDGTLTEYLLEPCDLTGTTLQFLGPGTDGYTIGSLTTDSISIRRDTSGGGPPDPYTLLIRAVGPQWSVGPGETLEIHLPVQVTQSNLMNIWLHGGVATGDGRIDVDQQDGAIYNRSWCTATDTSRCDTLHAKTNVGPPYDFLSFVNIVMTGGVSGTATFRSIGIHYAPPQTPPPASDYCAFGDVCDFGTTDGPATLPTAGVYTGTDGSPSPNGVQYSPANTAAFATALTSAACGDIIELAAGTTYTGNFTFPNKGCDASHWITIRSSGVTLPAFPKEGVRATPCEINQASMAYYPTYTCPTPAVRMATIQTNSANTPAMTAAAGANHYRFIGINFAKAAGSPAVSNALVNLSAGTDHIIFDRNLFHGQPYTGVQADEMQRGINTNGSTYLGIINNSIYDIYCMSACVDSQGFSGGTSALEEGPIWATNNFIAVSGESWIEGGGGVGATTAVPHDIYVGKNHSFKPLSWMLPIGASGAHPINKNGGEFKSVNRALVEGNVCENSWQGWQTDQAGYCFLATPKSQNSRAALTANISGTTVTATSGSVTSDMADRTYCPVDPADGVRRCIFQVGVNSYRIATATPPSTLTLTQTPGDQTGASVYACHPGLDPVAIVTNLTIRYNEIRNATNGIQIASVPSSNCLDESLGMNRISVHDILFHGLDALMSNGNSAQGNLYSRAIDLNNGLPNAPMHDIKIDHITAAVVHADKWAHAGLGQELDATAQAYLANMSYTNNVAPAAMHFADNQGGLINGGAVAGLGEHDCSGRDGVTGCTWTFAKNLLGTGQWDTQLSGAPYPSSNQTCGGVATCFPDGGAFAAAFVNYNGGFAGDYHIAAASPYKNAGTDGKDLGADIDTITTKTAGVRNPTTFAALTVTTASLPGGTANSPYSQALAASTGAGPFKQWFLTSGTLPAGLALSRGGTISGTPTTNGTSNFTIQVQDGGRQTATANLAITIGLPTPAATLTPASLTYGSQVIGNPSPPQSATLANIGNALLTISSIAMTGDFASAGTSNCGGTLAVGASCHIDVVFTPTGTGTRAGVLTVTDNAPGSPRTVSLTGTGTSGGGNAVNVYPSSTTLPLTASIPFSAVVVGNADQTVTWKVNGVTGGNSSVGTITAAGIYTAPLSAPGAITIGATSAAVGITGTASATVSGSLATYACTYATGDNNCTMTLNGVHRQFLVHVPANFVAGSSPLFVFLPGGDVSTDIACKQSTPVNENFGWTTYVDSLASPAPMLVCLQGLKYNRSGTQDPPWWGSANVDVTNFLEADGVTPAVADDFGFFRNAIWQIYKNKPFDLKRIGVGGQWLNGGMMAEQLAIYSSDLVAAFVSYGVNPDHETLNPPFPSAPKGPVSALIITGTASTDVTAMLCGGGTIPSIDESIAYWCQAGGVNCSGYNTASNFCSARGGTWSNLQEKHSTGGTLGTEVRGYALVHAQAKSYCSANSGCTPVEDFYNTSCPTGAPWNDICNASMDSNTGTDMDSVIWKFLATHPKP